MNIIEIIAQDVFDKVRSRFTNLQMGNEDGTVTSNPKEARFFDFDFTLEGNNLGRVSISINERGSLKVFYSQGITEGQDGITRGLWYDFLKEMRFFAKRRMMRFDTRDITKGNLDKNDFQYLAINGSKEDNMNESSMYGSSKTSYRKIENTRLVVRHGKAVDEGQSGARSRHIESLFIENADGERFKYPFTHLAGAKAMQRHVANGGRPYDDAGTAIIQMSEQIAQLATFKRHARAGLLNDDTNIIHTRVGAKLEQLRHTLNSIQGQKSYESWMESFVPTSINSELDPVTMEDYKNKFTVKQFDETLASVFPLIHAIMQEAGTLDLEDLVSEGEECSVCHKDPCECDDEEHVKEGSFDAFENWADAIVEGTMTPDQVAQFKDLLASGITLGPDATSAIEALQSVGISDKKLEQALKSLADVDPAADPMETIEAWLKNNDPDVLAQLGMDSGEEPAPTEQPAPAPEADPAAAPAPEGEVAEDSMEEAPEDRTSYIVARALFDKGVRYEDHNEDHIIGEMAHIMLKKLGFTHKEVRYHLNYDEDFIPDTLSELRHMEKAIDEVGVNEEEDMDNHEPRGEEKTQSVSLKELAEFIGAFYNPHAKEQGLGEWRKGPTELGIMAGKQFGDRAGKMVELMVKKMQGRTQEGDHQFSEVMKLAGIAVPEGSKGFDPLKHVKNPTPGEKKAAKDVKRGSYADRAAMLKSAEADGRLKKDESFDVMLKLAGLAK